MSVSILNSNSSSGLINSVPKKKVSSKKKTNPNRKLERAQQAMDVAQKLPPLPTPIKRLNCYSTYTEGHSLLIQKHFNPLMSPPQSILPLIRPLRSFAKQLPVTDPTFTFFISPKIGTLNGLCNHTKKRIHVFNSKSTRLATTLLHELSHFAIAKLGWKTDSQKYFREHIMEEASKDITALSAKNWKSCDRAVKKQLARVALYRQEKRWEECIVRVPQIISQIAAANPTESFEQIEARINKDIPHLYKIYKAAFLPELRAYVAKTKVLRKAKPSHSVVTQPTVKSRDFTRYISSKTTLFALGLGAFILTGRLRR